MTQFIDFMNQVPNEVLQKTEKHFGINIALFKPLEYIGGIKFDVTDYHIVIPSETTPDILFNNKMLHSEQRKIIIINPGDKVNLLKRQPAKQYYSILIKPHLIHKIAKEMNFFDEIRFENNLNPFSMELLQIFKSLEWESSRPDRLNLVLDSIETQISALLLRKFKTNVKTSAVSFEDADSYIHLAMEYIQTYFNSNISLKDICKNIHVSYYHFIRTFQKKVGMTPYRYLLNVRIEKAKELLATRCYSVTETALLCGFESISHFSDTFKKSTGFSPDAYKKQYY